MKKRMLSILLALLCACMLVGRPSVSADTFSGRCGDHLTWEMDGQTGALTISGTGPMWDYDWYEAPAPWGTSVTSAVLCEGVTGIGTYAFAGCEELTSVVIPSTVQRIEDQAFYWCSSLGEITIPEGVTSIGWNAFTMCSGLKSVRIPSSVECINYYAFSLCANLSAIWVDEKNPNYSSDAQGVLFDKGKTELIVCPGGFAGLYVIPESVIRIDADAFAECRALTDVVIPEHVFEIGDSAFSGCGRLDGIWVDEQNPNYSSDGRGVLFDKQKTMLICCPGGFVGEYAIPDSVKRIGWGAFSNCWNLMDIRIPDSVTAIEGFAFYVCLNLKDVTIPESVTEIGMYAFGECPELKSITVCNPTCAIHEEPYTLGWIGTTAIYGYLGSTAQQYAETYGYSFCALDAFYDVPDNVWYTESVRYAVAHGLFRGMTETLFGPEAAMTRGMLVTVLYRHEGSPEVTQAAGFADVPEGIYYNAPIAWASGEGVVNGVEPDRFCPEERITREQLATMLYRYAQKKGYDLSGYDDLSAYPDCGSVSPYAFAAMQWAVGAGLVKGADGLLDPQGSATRAQVATILMRFIENVEN